LATGSLTFAAAPDVAGGATGSPCVVLPIATATTSTTKTMNHGRRSTGFWFFAPHEGHDFALFAISAPQDLHFLRFLFSSIYIYLLITINPDTTLMIIHGCTQFFYLLVDLL
jgi:hypothetical protein